MVTQSAVSELVSPEAIRTGLRAIRYDRPLAEVPLARLSLVDAELDAQRLDDSAESRSWALIRVLDKTIWGALENLRAPSEVNGSRAIMPVPKLKHLTLDIRSSKAARRFLGVVYLRYLATERMSAREIATLAGITPRTLARWLERGHRLVAREIRVREAELARQ